MSESVSKALILTGGSDARETAIFVSMFDTFFDTLNVSNYTTGMHARQSFQQPYRSEKDCRLKVIAIEST